MSLMPNPSQPLETVDPVVLGKVRAISVFRATSAPASTSRCCPC